MAVNNGLFNWGAMGPLVAPRSRFDGMNAMQGYTPQSAQQTQGAAQMYQRLAAGGAFGQRPAGAAPQTAYQWARPQPGQQMLSALAGGMGGGLAARGYGAASQPRPSGQYPAGVAPAGANYIAQLAARYANPAGGPAIGSTRQGLGDGFYSTGTSPDAPYQTANNYGDNYARETAPRQQATAMPGDPAPPNPRTPTTGANAVDANGNPTPAAAATSAANMGLPFDNRRLQPSMEYTLGNNFYESPEAYRTPHPQDLANFAGSKDFRQPFLMNDQQSSMVQGVYNDMAPTTLAAFNAGQGRYNTLQSALENRAMNMNMPTVAEQAGRAQQQLVARNVATQAAQAMGGRYDPAVAARSLSTMAGLGQDQAAQTAMAASQERMGYLTGATDALQRQQQLGITAGVANAAELQNRQTATQGSYLDERGFNQNMWNNLLARENISAGLAPAAIAAEATRDAANSSMTGNMVGGFLGALGAVGGGYLAMQGSDRRAKEQIKDGAPAVRKFLDAIRPFEYKYKDGAFDESLAPKGRNVSVMAQDLEKAGPAGKRMVINTPKGKVVDYAKGLPAYLAAMADMHKRIKALEGA